MPVLDTIDAKTQEIKPADDEVYTNMLDLADELPDSSPRFILLSYPLTLVRVALRVCDLPQPPSQQFSDVLFLAHCHSHRDVYQFHMCSCTICQRTAIRARG